MTKQVINNGSVANDGTGDTLRSAAQKINENFTEIYSKLGDGTYISTNLDFDSTGIIFEGATQNAFETSLYAVDPTSDHTVYIPDYSGLLVMDSATQTLDNKTILTPTITNPVLKPSVDSNGITVTVPKLAANRQVSFPTITANDQFTLNAATQTLSNKTIQQPTINHPIIGNYILDSNEATLLDFTTAANSINFVNISNAQSGAYPQITTKGGETNVGLDIETKGAGAIRLNSKVVLGVQTITTNGTNVVSTKPITISTPGSSTTYTSDMNNGTVDGEVKYIINEGAGTAVVNSVSSNINNYTSITMTQGESVQMLWLASSAKWFIINNNGATLA